MAAGLGMDRNEKRDKKNTSITMLEPYVTTDDIVTSTE